MNKSDLKRNQYQLKGKLRNEGYDWWWHSFTAKHETTGKEQAFFIEYFIINPALGGNAVILGESTRKPSYVMIKVGAWGENAKQVHNFIPITDSYINDKKLEIVLPNAYLSEDRIIGKCEVSPSEALANPAWFSDSGSMTWDLKVSKEIAFHVGYGASRFFRWLNAFEMYWHAEGIKTTYEGIIKWEGQTYIVSKDSSYGYADKNWGRNFTSPWLWISSSNLYSEKHQKTLDHSALEIGGGKPKVFGISLNRKLLMGLHYEGIDYDFNFSHFWSKSNITFEFKEQSPNNIWHVVATNKKTKITVKLQCPQNEMLFIRYESPDGQMRHKKLWNGGTATGVLKIYDIKSNIIIDTLIVKNAGCEYGTYDIIDR